MRQHGLHGGERLDAGLASLLVLAQVRLGITQLLGDLGEVGRTRVAAGLQRRLCRGHRQLEALRGVAQIGEVAVEALEVGRQVPQARPVTVDAQPGRIRLRRLLGQPLILGPRQRRDDGRQGRAPELGDITFLGRVPLRQDREFPFQVRVLPCHLGPQPDRLIAPPKPFARLDELPVHHRTEGTNAVPRGPATVPFRGQACCYWRITPVYRGLSSPNGPLGCANPAHVLCYWNDGYRNCLLGRDRRGTPASPA